MSDGKFEPLGNKEVSFQFGAVRGVITPGCEFVFQPASGAFGVLALLKGFPGADAVCLKVFFNDKSKDGGTPPPRIMHEVEVLRSQGGSHAPAFVCLGRAVISKNEEYWAIVQENLKDYQTLSVKAQEFWGHIDEDGSSIFREYLGVLLSVANAIESVHKSGHVHRDLSSKNVMVEKKSCLVPDVRLIDFGEANRRFDFAGTVQLKDRHLGTPGYTAPEVFNLSNRTGRASKSTSVYSLGALAFFAATGHMPHDTELEEERERGDSSQIDPLVHLEAISRIEMNPIPLVESHRRFFASNEGMRRVLLFIDHCTLCNTAWRPTIEECKSLLGRLIDVNIDGLSRDLNLSTERLDILTRAASREFAEGDGSESNLRRVAALASFCADAGSSEAALLAGTSLERLDGKLGSCGLQLAYYRMAADGGLPAGMAAAARLILSKDGSTDADRSYALRLLSKASGAGNAFAGRLLRRYS